MTPLFILAVDEGIAGHLALALHRRCDALQKNGYRVPPELAQLETAALRSIKGTHQTSPGRVVIDRSQDDVREREYLSRRDVQRIANVSSATVDRWIKTGSLPSRRHGRVRRIARADLTLFLTAT